MDIRMGLRYKAISREIFELNSFFLRSGSYRTQPSLNPKPLTHETRGRQQNDKNSYFLSVNNVYCRPSNWCEIFTSIFYGSETKVDWKTMRFEEF